MKSFYAVIALIFISALPVYAGKWSTGTTAPATCTVGDSWTDTDGTADNRFYTCTVTNTWTLNSNQTAIDAKADKAQAVRYWADHADGTTLAVGTLVAYEGKIYATIQAFLKTSGSTPVGFSAYFEPIAGATYTLPAATANTLGGVKVGERLTMTDGVLSADVQTTDISGKQDTLVSGTNIKTVNSTSLLGSGNIDISGSSVPDGTVDGQVLLWATDQWVASTAPWLSAATFSTENSWTAVQNFNAGLTATGLTQNLTSWVDWTFAGTQIVNANGTGDNQLLPASVIISRLAAKADGVHTHPGVYEPVDPTILRTEDIDSKAELEAIMGETLGGTGAFSFDSFPVYENSPYASKIAFDGATGTLAIYDSASSKWLLSAAGAFTDTLGPAPVAPTLTGITIGANGIDLTLTSASSLTNGTISGNVDCTTAGQDIAFTYASGSPGTSLIYTLNSAVTAGDVCDLDYISGITATSGGAALAAITNGSVTNSSTQSLGIFDDFSVNTTIANYTTINGSLTISSGAMRGVAYTNKWMYHNTATGSNDHWVQADITPGGSTTDGGVIGVRSDGTTGYQLTITHGTPGQIILRSFNGSTVSAPLTGTKNPDIANAVHTVKLSVSGSTFTAWLDGVSQGTWTDTTYSTGQYIVVGSKSGSSSSAHTVDNLSGGL